MLWLRPLAPPGFRCFRVALLVRGQRLKGLCPVMQRSADRTMNDSKGGDIVMERLEAEHAVLHARDSATGTGGTRLQPPLYFSSWIKFFRAKEASHPVDAGCGSLGEAFSRARVGGVDSVHTLGHGLGRTGAGLGRIPHVSAGVQCLQGLEPGSSPTSGTCFPCSGAFGWFFSVHIVHTLASELMFRVCGVPETACSVCGGVADYGGPLTALWGPIWVFILVRPSLGFSRSPLHGG